MRIDKETGAAIIVVFSKLHGPFQVLVDVSDYERVNSHIWSVRKEKNSDCVYFFTNIPNPGGKPTKTALHRFIMAAPAGMCIDHKDPGTTLDNRRSNLRVATNKENSWNRRPNRGGTSQYKGVCWDASTENWQVHITVSGTTVYLGRRDCEVTAARLYDVAAIECFGEFALLNFPIEIAA